MDCALIGMEVSTQNSLTMIYWGTETRRSCHI